MRVRLKCPHTRVFVTNQMRIRPLGWRRWRVDALFPGGPNPETYSHMMALWECEDWIEIVRLREGRDR